MFISILRISTSNALKLICQYWMCSCYFPFVQYVSNLKHKYDFLNWPPPGATNRGHHSEPPPGATTQGHHSGPPPGATTQGHHPGPPPGATTRGHHLGPPPGATTWGHHTGPPHGATTRGHHSGPPPWLARKKYDNKGKKIKQTCTCTTPTAMDISR